MLPTPTSYDHCTPVRCAHRLLRLSVRRILYAQPVTPSAVLSGIQDMDLQHGMILSLRRAVCRHRLTPQRSHPVPRPGLVIAISSRNSYWLGGVAIRRFATIESPFCQALSTCCQSGTGIPAVAVKIPARQTTSYNSSDVFSYASRLAYD